MTTRQRNALLKACRHCKNGLDNLGIECRGNRFGMTPQAQASFEHSLQRLHRISSQAIKLCEASDAKN